jgi:hypothetical protein
VTITVDTNVLLDVVQKREPHYEASARVVSLVTSGQLDWRLSQPRPHHALLSGAQTCFQAGSRGGDGPGFGCVSHWQFGSSGEARTLAMTDFEDAAVAMVTKTSASEFIVTRNVDDFVRSAVPAITPVDFLSQFPA